jgi:membrane-bound lytic murein transglycosylase F
MVTPLHLIKCILNRSILALLLVPLGLFSGCYQSSSSSAFIQKPLTEDDGLTDVSAKESNSSGRIEALDPSLSRYTPLIKTYSLKYGVDWMLVLAVVQQESKFNNEAVSRSGAYGLMQLMPLTQIELTEKLGVEEAISPRNNIKAGVYHLSSLYRYFKESRHEDRIKLTLAAYNAGLKRVTDARRIARYLGNNPLQWSSVKDALPLLSSRGYSLHQSIWPDGKPESGYMRNSKQTITYVETISRNYDLLRTSL